VYFDTFKWLVVLLVKFCMHQKKKTKKYLYFNSSHFIFATSFFRTTSKTTSNRKNESIFNNTTPPASSRDNGKVLVTNQQHYLNNTAAACAVRNCLCLSAPFPYWFCRRGDRFAISQSPVPGKQRSQMRVEIEPRPCAARDAVAVGFLKSREKMALLCRSIFRQGGHRHE